MGGPFTVYTAHAVPPRIKAAASFHGGGLVREDDQSPHKLLAETQASYLFAIAQDDDAKAPQDKTVLRQSADAAGRPAMVDVYAGDHGWTVPDSPAYDRAAAERAYADGFALFSRAL
jgi:carboxymethylenebutenolidase